MSYRYDGNGQFTDEKAGKSAPTQNSDPWASQPQQKRSGSGKPSDSDVGSCGNAEGEEFPLLVKIIDAFDNLSIQVHPDDYAHQQAGRERRQQ